MSKRGHFFLAGTAMLFSMMFFAAEGMGAASVEESAAKRIQLRHPSPQEMDGALFDHGSHYASVKKNGGSCETCHSGLAAADKGAKISLTIIPESKSKEKMKDAWHAFCMDCHAKNAGTPSPASCHSCHDSKAPEAGMLPVRFDRSLHARHVDSRYIEKVMPEEGSRAMLGELQNCGACHSSTLEGGKTAYVRGTEDASTFFGTVSRDPKALSSSAHAKCVTCHISVMKNGGANAAALGLPVECASCHSSKGQAMFPSVSNAPRLYRGQPDVVEMGVKESANKDLDKAKAVKSVPFNHKAHEASVSCMECHGPAIAKADRDGKGGAVFSSAHDPQNPLSCIGCHAMKAKADRNCAGCHADMRAGNENSCAVCHRGNGNPGTGGIVSAASGKVVHQPVPANKIPETVTIGSLSKEYEPVVFQHRKVYEVMLRGVGGNALSDAFHAQSMCLSCHHHIPGENIANPPNCSACHDKAISPAKASKAPYLKTAYHQLCIGCHASMNVKPDALDCSGCHTPVQKTSSTQNKRKVR